MQKNKSTKLVEECRHELRMWVDIIVYEEDLLIPQIGTLATEVNFQHKKDLVVIHWIPIDTFWNVMGQEYSLRVPKDNSH